jgi:predicted methyltransferase
MPLSTAWLSLVAGCAAQPACAPAAAPQRETSVAPGINQEYRDADVDVWVQRFETESREVFAQRQRIVDAMAISPGQSVADIGAGTGLFTLMLAKAVGPQGKVYAVDIVPEFLTHIRSNAEAAGLHNIETVLCEEDSVELPSRAVDLAFLCDTYHHFEYPRSTLASIHRALRPGGSMFVVDFKRIPGESRDWVLNHVRAAQDVCVQEIRAAGFELLDDRLGAGFLKENYMIRFRRTR